MKKIVFPFVYYKKLVHRSELCFNYIHTSRILERTIRFDLSDIGEGIAEVQIKDWHVKVGDPIDEFDELCSVQSDKASVTITSRYTGTIKKLYHSIDDIAKVGQPLVDIEVEEKIINPPEISTAIPTHFQDGTININGAEIQSSINNVPVNTSVSQQKILTAPSVRRIIREHNLDTSKIPSGSGKGGRILKEDILKILENTGKEITDLNKVSKAIQQSSTAERIVPIRGYTRTMIKTMSEALKIPHFGYSDEFVVDKLMDVKSQLNGAFSCQNKIVRERLSYMPIIIKATSLALNEFPILNSRIGDSMETLIYISSHNISLAMDTPDGLVVPNIKNCQEKTIWEIAIELSRLVALARDQRLLGTDLQGGTFSLSNIGALNGGTYANPIIFPPQVAIGALGKIREVPRFDSSGNLVPVRIMHFSWAADHRVIDGATVARFSNRLKQFIEEPVLMLAEMR